MHVYLHNLFSSFNVVVRNIRQFWPEGIYLQNLSAHLLLNNYTHAISEYILPFLIPFQCTSHTRLNMEDFCWTTTFCFSFKKQNVLRPRRGMIKNETPDKCTCL